MATFTGTLGDDNFVGLDDVSDTFNFGIANLSGSDTVTGGGGTGIDILNIQSAGALAPGLLAGVSGIERIVLQVGSISLTLNNGVAAANSTSGLLSVVGSGGSDTVDGSAVTNGVGLRFVAGAGDDRFFGGAGTDSVYLSSGQLTGADTLSGGDGIDTFQIAGSGAVAAGQLSGVSGFERVSLISGNLRLALDDSVVAANNVGGQLTIFGSSGADSVDGSSLSAGSRLYFVAGDGDDSFQGGGGDDIVRMTPAQLTAADTIIGGAGLDVLQLSTAGGTPAFQFAGVQGFERIVLLAPETSLYLSDAAVLGNDPSGLMTVYGSSGRDWVDGATLTSAARLQVFGGDGNDILYGGGGHDSLYGGSGIDQINSGGGGVAYGGADNDRLTGGGALYGQAGDDNLEGFAANDWLSGGAGNDYFYSGGGIDTIFGDAGNDFVDDSGQDSIDAGAGIDTIGVSFISSNVSHNYGFNPVNGAITTPLGSTVINVEAVNLFGGTNNDTLRGGASHDQVRGWQGNDVLYGGAGNDFIIGDNGSDTAYGGDGDDTVTGNGNSDTLYGGNGNDWIIGGRPFDVFGGGNMLIGGPGADTLEGGNGTTTLSFETSSAGVYVDFVRGRGFGGDAQGDVYRGVGGIVYLSNFDDLAVGGAELFGLDGNDTLVRTAATRAMSGGDGADTFELSFDFATIFEPLTITDFDGTSGDIIDLSRIDARPALGDQAFTFIGTADFTATPGQARYRIENGNTIVELQMRDDATPEHTFVLSGVHTLSAEDFVL